MQSLQADSQNFSGFGLVVVGGFESLQDEEFLRFSDRGADAQAHRVGIVHRRSHRRLTETGRQMLGFNHRTFTNDRGPLQRIAQLAHISRPGVIAEQIEDGFAQRCNLAAMLFIHVGQQRMDEIGNIFLVLAQRWHVNVENIQPIVE